MKKRSYVVCIVLFAIYFISINVSFASAGNVDKEILENGTTVLCKYLPESPISVIQIRVLSGLSNEGEFAGSGISHFLEHLIFKGTKDRTTEEFFDDIRRMGGLINGFTGMDSAAYHLTVPNESLEEAISLLSDMVMEPVFSDEDMKKEREVIIKEINLRYDSPGTKRIQQLFGAAYSVNLYKHPIIGHLERFKGLSKEDVLYYHERAYTPERMIVGVAGGVRSDVVADMVREKFSAYKRGDGWNPVVQEEPRQLMQRRAVMGSDVNLGYMSIGFHSTDIYSPDVYAMDVLAALLGAGRASRLYEKLVVGQELLTSISASNMTPKYKGMFMIRAEGKPENLKKAEEVIFEVINSVKDQPVTDKELQRVKNMVSAGYIRSNEKVADQVNSMTSSQSMVGDPYFHEYYVDKINEVTAEDVKKAASKYLFVDNSTLSMVIPEEFKEKMLENAGGDERGTAQEAEVRVMKNGMKVIVLPRGTLPLISCQMIFHGGLSAESAEKMGISSLTASLVTKGTNKRSEKEIVPVFEYMGGGISASSGKNTMSVSMNILSKDLDQALDIFEDVITGPVFPDEEIEKQKKKTIAAVQRQGKSIGHKAARALREVLYEGHPYSFNNVGEIDTIEDITRDDIVAFYKKYFVPEGSVLVFVGDVDKEMIFKKVNKYFGSWRGKEPSIDYKDIKPLDRVTHIELEMEKEQSLLLMGFPGVDIKDPRKYPLWVISSMLSSGGGMLFEAIRQDEGLAYSCGATSNVMFQPGYFLFTVKTSKENIEKVRGIVEDVIFRVKNGDFTEEELVWTKNKMMTGYATSIETSGSIAGMMARGEFSGLGYKDYLNYPEKIKNVTKEDIISASNEIFDLDNFVTVIVYSDKT